MNKVDKIDTIILINNKFDIIQKDFDLIKKTIGNVEFVQISTVDSRAISSFNVVIFWNDISWQDAEKLITGDQVYIFKGKVDSAKYDLMSKKAIKYGGAFYPWLPIVFSPIITKVIKHITVDKLKLLKINAWNQFRERENIDLVYGIGLSAFCIPSFFCDTLDRNMHLIDDKIVDGLAKTIEIYSSYNKMKQFADIVISKENDKDHSLCEMMFSDSSIITFDNIQWPTNLVINDEIILNSDSNEEILYFIVNSFKLLKTGNDESKDFINSVITESYKYAEFIDSSIIKY